MKNVLKKAVDTSKKISGKVFKKKKNRIVAEAEKSEKNVDKRAVNLGAQLCEMGFERARVACVTPDNGLAARLADTAVKMLSGKLIRFDPVKCGGELVDLVVNSGATLVFCDGESEKIFLENRDRLQNVKYFVCFKRKRSDGDFLSFAGTLLAGSLLTASTEAN